MQSYEPKEIFKLHKLKLAVIGHIEWVTFLKVDKLPKAGVIGHAYKTIEEPAGGAVVAALQMQRLINKQVHLMLELLLVILHTL